MKSKLSNKKKQYPYIYVPFLRSMVSKILRGTKADWLDLLSPFNKADELIFNIELAGYNQDIVTSKIYFTLRKNDEQFGGDTE